MYTPGKKQIISLSLKRQMAGCSCYAICPLQMHFNLTRSIGKRNCVLCLDASVRKALPVYSYRRSDPETPSIGYCESSCARPHFWWCRPPGMRGWVQEACYKKVVSMDFCRLGIEGRVSGFWHPWISRNVGEVGHRSGFGEKRRQSGKRYLEAFYM